MINKFVYIQRVLEMFIDFHDSCLVSTAIAVVWSTEYGNDIAIMTPVISL